MKKRFDAKDAGVQTFPYTISMEKLFKHSPFKLAS